MAKVIGKGSTLTLGSGEDAVLVGQLVDIDWSGVEKGNQETTELGQQDREYMPTSTGWGNVGFTVWYDPGLAGHIKIKTILELPASDAVANGNTPWSIKLVDALETTVSGVGIVSFDPLTNLTTDGYIQAKGTIVVSGRPVWTNND